MTTHIIIQARMGSRRLPGKIMEPIGGLPALEHVVRRAKMVEDAQVTIATPHAARTPGTRKPARWFKMGYAEWFQGDEDDVLGRVHGAAVAYNPTKVVVRLTADCPFVPVAAIREAIAAVEAGADFVETRSDPSTRPNGIDVQAFRPSVLTKARLAPATPAEREHVTPALHRAARNRTTVDMVEGVPLDDLPPWRMTLDTEEDLAWFRAVAALTNVRPPHPTLREFMQLMQDHPELERMDT